MSSTHGIAAPRRKRNRTEDEYLPFDAMASVGSAHSSLAKKPRLATVVRFEDIDKRKEQFLALISTRYTNQVLVQSNLEKTPGKPTFEEALSWLSKEHAFFSMVAKQFPDTSKQMNSILEYITLHSKSVEATRASIANGPQLPFHSLEQRLESAKNAGLSVQKSERRDVPTGTDSSCDILAKISSQVISWEQLGGFPRQVSNTILKALREIMDDVILHTVEASGGELTQSLRNLSKGIPIDIRTLHNSHDETDGMQVFHCCPTCRGIRQHKIDEEGAICNAFRAGKPNCTTKLSPLTVEIFVHYPMTSYIANLLNTPGTESQLESVWTGSPPAGSYSDIWDGSVLKNLKWPAILDDPIYNLATTPLKLVWALYIDWHNPFFNKKAGKLASIGSIQLVCLNLPPSERYKPHNRLLSGIIPGPKEPDVDEIPPFLRKIVDDLKELFTGVFFTRTSDHPNGRAVHCCLGPVVCDLPASRKVAGFTSYTSDHPCHACDFYYDVDKVKKEEKVKLLISIDESRRRKKEDVFIQSDTYLALNLTRRKKKAKETGIRYSELNGLPNYDPIKHVVVDPMHCLHLGVAKHHFRKLLGLEEDLVMTPETLTEEKVSEQLSKLAKNWSHAPRTYNRILEAMLIKNQVSLQYGTKVTKANMVEALDAWCKLAPGNQLQLPSVAEVIEGPQSKVPTSECTAEELASLRYDLQHVVLPSHIDSPPRNFGSASHGKLKADAWFVLTTIIAPITFIRLWSTDGEFDRKGQLLRHLIMLSQAIWLANRKFQTDASIAEFHDYISKYVAAIPTLFEGESVVPNHHVALHIHEYMKAFGPVYSWSCYPCERVIGKLQKMRTNGRINSIPETYMKTFLRLQTTNRNTEKNQENEEPQLRSGSFNRDGLTFQTASKLTRSGQSKNSRILIKLDSQFYAAQITDIKTYDRFEATLTVKKFINLAEPEAASDPYRQLTNGRMWLVHNKLDEDEIRIPSSSVVCHLVYCVVRMPQAAFVGKKLAVVVSLQ